MKDPNDNATKDLVVAQTAQRQMQQVAIAYGDNLPYSYDRVLNECAFFMEQSAVAAIELGKRLILIKEMEGHGKYGQALDSLGLSRFTAAKVMNAVIKLPSNVSTSTHLLQQVKSKSKLLELMILDDVDLQELSDGGTVAGLKLDDVDRMSVRELRVALRESRETITSKDSVMKAKDTKLNEMAEKINTLSRAVAEKDRQKALEKPTPEAEGQGLRTETIAIVTAIETDGIIRQLQQAFLALKAHSIKSNIDHNAFMAGCINQIKRAINMVQADFELYLDDDSDTPYWMTDAAQRAADEQIAKLDIDWMDVSEGDQDGKAEH